MAAIRSTNTKYYAGNSSFIGNRRRPRPLLKQSSLMELNAFPFLILTITTIIAIRWIGGRRAKEKRPIEVWVIYGTSLPHNCILHSQTMNEWACKFHDPLNKRQSFGTGQKHLFGCIN